MKLLTTRGIVLHQVRYSETSVILRVYTEAFGLCSFMLKGVRKTNPRISPALLQHLTQLEMVAAFKGNADIQHLREIRNAFPYQSIPFVIEKSAVGLFVSELMNKVLKEEEPNPDLYGFLSAALCLLDLSTEPARNFHLWFALQLTRFAGFLPAEREEGMNFFELQEGLFHARQPLTQYVAEEPYASWFYRLSRPTFREYWNLVMTNAERRQLLHHIITYYRLHIQSFGTMKSHRVLEEVLG